MRIPGKELFRIVPGAARKVEPGSAIAVMQRRYCSRVHAAGYCTAICDNCASSLRSAFQRLNLASGVKKPTGLLVWLAREEAAKYIEMRRETEKIEIGEKKTALFEEAERSPFLGLLE